ncbi:heterokaryon incompatibility protein-domain-containing protein [Xylaria castorea]|nr:heterokaryon incompatibility protein-domain-containing protein [Xylaria castorea]
MRLLHTQALRLQYFMPGQIPDYVILSHLWGNEEIMFRDFTKQGTIDPDSRATERQGFSKVEGACKLAARDGYEWIWIDTCCIDKSSSAELQEAINTMWRYYAQSNICYAYMVDVSDTRTGWSEPFQRSKWFTRGWTLQELIAPTSVEFYAKDWAPIGTKSERYEEISEITKINIDVLTHTEPIDAFSAAEKMSWAAHRQVTREEDETYSLLGLFEVNMPMLYGEGRRRAFVRLQEAIYSSTLDHSLFLFCHSTYTSGHSLLADSPACFCPEQSSCTVCPRGTRMFPVTIPYRQLVAASSWINQAHEPIWTTITPSRHEVSTTLQLLDYDKVSNKLIFFEDRGSVSASHVAVLNHTVDSHLDGALCLLLYSPLKWEEAVGFIRLEAYPVLLPHLKEFASQIRSKRVLICPQDRVTSIELSRGSLACFTLTSESFVVQCWRAKRVLDRQEVRVAEQTSPDFTIRMEIARPPKKSSEVSCRIMDNVDHSRQITIGLAWISMRWSIKEVCEVKSRKRDRSRHQPFYSRVLCDRCSIVTSDGMKWSIALRRLATSKRGPNDGISFRYQIVVRRLELDERGGSQ